MSTLVDVQCDRFLTPQSSSVFFIIRRVMIFWGSLLTLLPQKFTATIWFLSKIIVRPWSLALLPVQRHHCVIRRDFLLNNNDSLSCYLFYLSRSSRLFFAFLMNSVSSWVFCHRFYRFRLEKWSLGWTRLKSARKGVNRLNSASRGLGALI